MTCRAVENLGPPNFVNFGLRVDRHQTFKKLDGEYFAIIVVQFQCARTNFFQSCMATIKNPGNDN